MLTYCGERPLVQFSSSVVSHKSPGHPPFHQFLSRAAVPGHRGALVCHPGLQSRLHVPWPAARRQCSSELLVSPRPALASSEELRLPSTATRAIKITARLFANDPVWIVSPSSVQMSIAGRQTYAAALSRSRDQNSQRRALRSMPGGWMEK